MECITVGKMLAPRVPILLLTLTHSVSYSMNMTLLDGHRKYIERTYHWPHNTERVWLEPLDGYVDGHVDWDCNFGQFQEQQQAAAGGHQARCHDSATRQQDCWSGDGDAVLSSG